MNLGKLFHRFRVPMLTLVVCTLVLFGAQSSSAQEITVSTPRFSVGSQHYSTGTYRFTLISTCFLSIRKVGGGDEKMFLIRHEGDRQLGAKGGLTFDESKGQRILRAVYIPGANMAAELVGDEIARNGE
ncbi:hypothetical protein P8936_08580 [Edaphobacter paludis]